MRTTSSVMPKPKVYEGTDTACPKCGESHMLTPGNSFTTALDVAEQRVVCLTCGCVFHNVYRFDHAEVYECEER